MLPNGFQSPMPRWLPDSSGLTFVDGDLLQRIDRDGDNLATLYVSPTELLDAAVADDFTAANPGAAHVAYVRSTAFLIVSAGGNTAPTTFFGTDVLGGGSRVEQDLGGIYGLAELAWHPDGASVWCQLNQFSQLIDGGNNAIIQPPPFAFEFLAVFDAASAATNRVINATFGAMDIDKVTGKALLWMQSAQQDAPVPPRRRVSGVLGRRRHRRHRPWCRSAASCRSDPPASSPRGAAGSVCSSRAAFVRRGAGTPASSARARARRATAAYSGRRRSTCRRPRGWVRSTRRSRASGRSPGA